MDPRGRPRPQPAVAVTLLAMDLYDELHRVVGALDAAGVPYGLVGGLALAVHGVPRATTDIDLLVLPADVDRALAAVRPLGFRFEAGPMRFPDGMRIRRVSRIEGGETLTLDLLLVDEQLETAWASRREIATERGTLRVIGRDALVAMKVRAGRARDLADVERLQEDDR